MPVAAVLTCARTDTRPKADPATTAKTATATADRFYGTISEVAQQRAERYEQVEKLLLERTSLRGIQRVTGVSRPTLSKLIKKK